MNEIERISRNLPFISREEVKEYGRWLAIRKFEARHPYFWWMMSLMLLSWVAMFIIWYNWVKS
jgi:hypothetical protein